MVVLTDPIADMIIRLKNASAVKKDSVSLPYSKMKEGILKTLQDAGFIQGYEKHGKGVKKTLTVTLSYFEDGTPRISHARRISKPGRRLYSGVADIKPLKYGFGIRVYSTPKGIMTDAQAKKENVGGEHLFDMY